MRVASAAPRLCAGHVRVLHGGRHQGTRARRGLGCPPAATAAASRASLAHRSRAALGIFSIIGGMVALLSDQQLNSAVDGVMVAQQVLAMVRGLEAFLPPEYRQLGTYLRMVLFDW
jgi:hypothetical protein